MKVIFIILVFNIFLYSLFGREKIYMLDSSGMGNAIVANDEEWECAINSFFISGNNLHFPLAFTYYQCSSNISKFQTAFDSARRILMSYAQKNQFIFSNLHLKEYIDQKFYIFDGDYISDKGNEQWKGYFQLYVAKNNCMLIKFKRNLSDISLMDDLCKKTINLIKPLVS